MLRLLSFLFLVSAFFSCLPEKTALERALREAGDNRMELEKVLAYYRDDTLKYQAACFLIENMPDQYAVLPLDSTDTYARALLSLDKEDPVSWEISRSLVAAVFDSISKIQPESRIKIVRDIEVMTSDYLIENIESAFKVWNRFSKILIAYHRTRSWGTRSPITSASIVKADSSRGSYSGNVYGFGSGAWMV